MVLCYENLRDEFKEIEKLFNNNNIIDGLELYKKIINKNHEYEMLNIVDIICIM